MTSKSFKIGVDFHGVITAAPSFFRDFNGLALSRGHEIHVVSGGPYLVERKFLDSWQIGYSQIFALVDYFAGMGKITYFANGNFKVPDELWNRAKAEYCLQNNINIQIDDTAMYGTFFRTPFALYNAAGHSCRIGGQLIDFSVSPEQSLNAVEAYLERII